MRSWNGAKLVTGFDREQLESLCDRIKTNWREFYRPFDVRRGKGKWRHIDQPIGKLQIVQKQIKEWLTRDFPVIDIQHGGVRKRSVVTAALEHEKAPTVVTLDIDNFFGRVTSDAVYWFFTQGASCTPDVARCLTRITTLAGHLPQGSSSSTILANLANRTMFFAIEDLALRHGCNVTVYVDDITVSGEGARACISGIMRILRDFGYSAQRRKTKVMTSRSERVVLGLSVGGGITLTIAKKRALRQQIMAIRQQGFVTKPQLRRLWHFFGWAQYVDPKLGKKIMQDLAALEESIEVVFAGDTSPSSGRETRACDITNCRAANAAVL